VNPQLQKPEVKLQTLKPTIPSVRAVTADRVSQKLIPNVKQFEELQERTRRFALRIIKLYRSLPKTDEARIVGKQVLRSGTSIGANYRAACGARSRAEFVAKLGIVLKEADETAFWLELMKDAGIFPEAKLRQIVQEAKELVSIFVTSVRTAKGFTSSI